MIHLTVIVTVRAEKEHHSAREEAYYLTSWSQGLKGHMLILSVKIHQGHELTLKYIVGI